MAWIPVVALALVAVMAVSALIIRWRLRCLQSLFESRLPADVTGRGDWWCRATVRPGMRTWTASNLAGESQAMTALTEVGALYPGWVPTMRLTGRGTGSRWVCTLRRPPRDPVPASLIRPSPDGRIVIGMGLDGRPVTVSEAASLLVVGLTGSGKGSIVATMIASLRRQGIRGLPRIPFLMPFSAEYQH